jgi:hypothetical protein
MKLITKQGDYLFRIMGSITMFVPIGAIIEFFGPLSTPLFIGVMILNCICVALLQIYIDHQIKEPTARDVHDIVKDKGIVQVPPQTIGEARERVFQSRLRDLNIIIILCMLAFSARAQNSIEVGIMPVSKLYSTYTSKLEGVSRGASFTYQFDERRNTADWAKLLHLAYIGIQANGYGMSDITLGGKPGLFGPSFSLVATAGVQLASPTATLGFELMPELGLGYEGKTFYNNNSNMIIGSHINVVSGARASLMLYLNDERAYYSPMEHKGYAEQRTILKLGLDFTHRSISGIVKPNDGINRVAFVVSVQQDIDSDTAYIVHHKVKKQLPLYVELIVGKAGVVKTGYYPQSKESKYPDTATQVRTPGVAKYNLSVNYSHNLGVIAIGTGVDAIYTPTTLNLTHFYQTYTGHYATYSQLDVGLHAQLSLLLGSLTLTAGNGYYIAGQVVDTHNYTFFSAQYSVTQRIALEAKAYTSNFGGLGMTIHI